MFVRLCVLLLVACRSAPSSVAPPSPIDLVLTGGKVFTADAGKSWAEAIAIRGDRIAAVGTAAEIRTLPGVGAGTRIIDLGGRTVIPGINDAHCHQPGVWQPQRVRVASRDPSFDEVRTALAAAAKQHPPGTWLTVPMGSEWYDDPRATRAFFDGVAPDHLVMGHDNAGHAQLLNTAALKAAGISLTEPDPPYGHYGRDSQGQLTGWLYEAAGWGVRRKLDEAHSDEAIARAADKFEQQALRFGITSVQTMSPIDGERLARVLSAQPRRIRWRLIRWARSSLLTSFDALAASARVRVDGVKYVLDGTPIERWAFVSSPYRDRPKTRGHLNYSRDEIRTIIEVAAKTREPLLLHAVGDAAIEEVLAAMERHAPAATWRPLRVRIEHGDMFTPGQIRRAAALGVVVVQNPIHFMGALIPKRIGDCGGTCQPFRSLIRGGVTLALGSDGPLDPYLGIMAAASHPISPSEAISREDAVIAYTRGAAHAEHAETEKGTLAPGMQADLAVLTRDIFTVAPDQLVGTEAWMTIVGGEIVHAME